MSDEREKRILHRMVTGDATGNQPYGWMFWCPGCDRPHGVWTEQPNEMTNAVWKFDGNAESPTFSPSILVHATPGVPPQPRCHSFIRAGQIQFCPDSEHSLAGKTVPLPLH